VHHGRNARTLEQADWTGENRDQQVERGARIKERGRVYPRSTACSHYIEETYSSGDVALIVRNSQLVEEIS